MTEANKARSKRKPKKGSKKRKKSPWSKQKTADGREIWTRDVPNAPDLEVAVGVREPGQWIAGIYKRSTDDLTVYPDHVYPTAKEAKAAIDRTINATIEDVRNMHVQRAANREVGDVVLVAEQYYAAQQDELDLMKRGTPEDLAKARARTKKARSSLESMTGANRELYGAIGGGTIGATLGALTGNVFASAIGALAGSVVGSVIAAPTQPVAAPVEPQQQPSRRPRFDDDVIPFPRRSPRPKTSGKGYVANPDVKRRLTKL